MARLDRYALLGAFIALLALAVFAAGDGYLRGAGERLQHPPGLRGMAWNAAIFVVGLGPAVGCTGAAVGGGVGVVMLVLDRIRAPKAARGPRRDGRHADGDRPRA